jgi:serine/threonine protein kinase
MTREDVENEAAILALLDDRHVVAVIGVVTVPRTMPTLLLLEYCENGSLDNYLRTQGPATPDEMVLRLSFCHDIAIGLNYIASRRVVHRDMAARNVSAAATSILPPSNTPTDSADSRIRKCTPTPGKLEN